MAPRKAVKKRTCPSSGASPSKGLNMRWVPEGMDSSTACRIAVRVPDYAHSSDDGRVVREPTKEFELVVDRDTTNLKDLTEELVERINLAENQGMIVAFWNRNFSSFCNVSSDSVLMDAMDLYWEIRRVPLFVTVYDTMSVDYSQSVSADHVVDNVVPAGDVSAIPVVPEVEQVVSAEDIDEHQMGPEGTEYMEDDANLEEDEDDVSLEEVEDDVNLEEDEDDVSLEEDENLEQDKCQIDGADENVKTKKYKMKKAPKVIDEEPWDEDDVEYVGLHDEHAYLSDAEAATMNDNESTERHSTDEDELYVDDEAGCEVLEHVTDLENPTIAVGETFEDAETFKRAIRQYAVLNEFEISAHYSEAKRYRGFCKGRRGKSKKCRWRIHASQLQDGKTWQIKKLYNKHNCASTAKLDNNCMATNAWVRDRVIDTLRDMPNTGAAQLKTDLESKYSINKFLGSASTISWQIR